MENKCNIKSNSPTFGSRRIKIVGDSMRSTSVLSFCNWNHLLHPVLADESHTFSRGVICPNCHIKGSSRQLSGPCTLVAHHCHSLSRHQREAQRLKRAICVRLCYESIFNRKPSSGGVPQSNEQPYTSRACWVVFLKRSIFIHLQ